MRKFTEWLSDYVRYFILLLAVLLLVCLAMIGVKVYQRYDRTSDGDSIEILTESNNDETETRGVAESETHSEAESDKTGVSGTKSDGSNTTNETDELQTGGDDTAKESEESQTDRDVTEDLTTDGADSTAQMEANTAGDTAAQNESETQADAGAVSDQTEEDAQSNVNTGTDQESAVSAENQAEGSGQNDIEIQNDAETSGDMRTILSACNLRSYPDYGDNIIGVCYEGQAVEFLGEEAGWYKISVDGTIGYIGPKFLG